MNIRVKITRDGSNTIKTIELEEYLRGVVPSEMPASWPAEALKAQAVAARTFAMQRIQIRQTKEYDVDDTVAFQAYRIGHERPSTDKAIKDTVNQYLTYNGKIVEAAYSSSNGGRTYSAEERWGGAIAYLISQPDPFNKEAKDGHGVGMSQYGARHRAEAGQTYDEILAFYYTKTVLENFTKEIKVDFNFTQYYLTKNECYLSGKKMTPAGIIVHSTGANNKTLKRYIGPDDGKLGVNKYGNHWNQVMDREVCVHAFIGTLADGTVACYQTLPWDMVGWHSGRGANGSANNMGYIGFEICEDDLTDAKYFNEIYEMAAHLCAYLCQEYNIPIEKVICHSEAHTLGIASNHGDVMHWFPKFGKNMDTFRTYVKTLVGNIKPTPTTNSGSEEDMIQYGQKNEEVRAYQNSLLTLGYAMPKYGADGSWGAETQAAHDKFQADNGIAASKMVDDKTQAALFNALRTKYATANTNLTTATNELTTINGQLATANKTVDALKNKISQATAALQA